MTKPDKKEFLRLMQQHSGLMQKVVRLAAPDDSLCAHLGAGSRTRKWEPEPEPFH